METPRPPDDPRNRPSPWKLGGGGRYLGLGLQFGGAILLFLFAGQWVDRRLGSDPWGVLIGVFTGFGAGFYSIYRTLTRDQARDDDAERPSP
jgi:F0F1-type ATP synthase assembly protein I